MKRYFLLLLLISTILLLTACSVGYSGTYGGQSGGIPVIMTLEKDGTATTNILGFPTSGHYKVSNGIIEITIEALGYSQTVSGKISKDKIEFSDMVLEKGVTAIDVSALTDIIDPVSQNSNQITTVTPLKNTATPVDKVTDDPNADIDKGNSVSFKEPILLQEICNQNGFDPLFVTENDLKKVTELDIVVEKVGLTGNIYDLSLEDLRYLTSLEVLNIRPSYEINLDLKGINSCKNLRKLNIQYCRMNDLERIGALTNLEELSILSVRGEGITDYSPLGNLTALKKLTLSWNGYNAYNPYWLNDASSISSLVNLEELTISYVGIKNYSLASMSKLKKVEITNYDANTLFSELYESGAWENLESLHCYVRALEPETLKALTKLSNLKYLYLNIDIYGSSTNLDGIGNLTKLETLIIPSIPYKINSMDDIGNLQNLKELRILSGADRNEISIDYLNRLTNLKCLQIGTIHKISLGKFSNLKLLETIEIDYDGGTNYNSTAIDLSGVENLPSLREIIYYGYKIKSTMPLDDYPSIVLTEKHLTW